MLQKISDYITSFISTPSLLRVADELLDKLQEQGHLSFNQRSMEITDDIPCTVTKDSKTYEYPIAVKCHWTDPWTDENSSVYVYEPCDIAARICILAEHEQSVNLQNPFA